MRIENEEVTVVSEVNNAALKSFGVQNGSLMYKNYEKEHWESADTFLSLNTALEQGELEANSVLAQLRQDRACGKEPEYWNDQDQKYYYDGYYFLESSDYAEINKEEDYEME